MAHDVGLECLCVNDHNPNPMELHLHHMLPLYLGGEKDGWAIPLCPTAHVNVHELLREWMKAGGKPAWEIRQRFGPFIRSVAEIGYSLWQARTYDG